jgi:3-hydroxybutyryl-CoA dehydratase
MTEEGDMKEGVSILEKLGINIGLKTIHMRTVTEADIASFAGVSGDFNPVHVAEEYAKKTLFGGRIAHGALAQAFL